MTSFGLKLFAMFSMIFDHIGFMFLGESELAAIFRVLGRFAFPIFSFQLAVGYTHSRSKERHILRMLVFALASQLPFMLFVRNALSGDYFSLNIGFTFTLGLLAMFVFDKFKNIPLRFFALTLVLYSSFILPVDYGLFGVLICLSFYVFKDKKYLNLISACLLIICKIINDGTLFNFTMIYALVPILLYTGKKGLDNKFSKYLFYVFYPVHLLLFALIKMII